jgi:hypothetical protein
MTPEELRQLGRLAMKYAGELNGKLRAKKLSKRRRSEIAKHAATARWSKESRISQD